MREPSENEGLVRAALGSPVSEYGTMFKWRDATDPTKEGTTVGSPFKHDTAYFVPSDKSFIINYRVEQLEELVSAGVVILDEIAVYDYGKFVHILDPEGNKFELWEDVS